MAWLLDGFKTLPSEIRHDICLKIFHDSESQGNGFPSFISALRGEQKLYSEALTTYYSLTTIQLTRETLPTFLSLSSPTKESIRKLCLDIRLGDAIYNPSGSKVPPWHKPYPLQELLEAATLAKNVEHLHLIPQLTILSPPGRAELPPPAKDRDSNSRLSDLTRYFATLVSLSSVCHIDSIQADALERLSDFVELKVEMVRRLVAELRGLKWLVVEPRLDGFLYFPDSFVEAVNVLEGLGKAKMERVIAAKRGEGEMWLWDLRVRSGGGEV